MKSNNKITHNQCIDISANWLANQKNRSIGWGCKIILREPSGYLLSVGESLPDILGIWDEMTVNIECKVSRSDFLSDKNKKHSHPIGNYKIYACPHNMILPSEIPNGWGLLYVNGRGGKLIVDPIFKKDQKSADKFMCDLILNGGLSGSLNSSHTKRPKNNPQWDGKGFIL
jgi:hypothetical protein